MAPIVGAGEPLDEREQGATDEKVRRQVGLAFNGLSSDDALRCVIAYEPIWAIGTGRNATPDDANATIAVIRDQVRTSLGDTVAAGLRILYGGRVKPRNT